MYCHLVELQPASASLLDIPEHTDNIFHSPHSNTKRQALAEPLELVVAEGKHKSQQGAEHIRLRVGRNIQHKDHSKHLDNPSFRAIPDPSLVPIQVRMDHKRQVANRHHNHLQRTHSILRFLHEHVQRQK